MRVERHPAAQERRCAEPAEHEVGVGDGRRRAAATVGGRARVGARAARPDPRMAARIDPADRAAARAHLHEVDHRTQDRVAARLLDAAARALVRADLELAQDARPAAEDQPHLRRRAAHVERDRIGDAQALGDLQRSGDTCGRPRFDRVDGPRANSFGRHHAAARAHHVERRAHPTLLEARRDPIEVAADHRRHVRVDDRRARAPVLADLGRELARYGQLQFRRVCADQRRGSALVLGFA